MFSSCRYSASADDNGSAFAPGAAISAEQTAAMTGTEILIIGSYSQFVVAPTQVPLNDLQHL